MRIAIAAAGEKLDDDVAIRLGKATTFVEVETESKKISTIRNKVVDLEEKNRGVRTAKWLVEKNYDAVICASFCDPSKKLLQINGIATFSLAGYKVATIVDQIHAGTLKTDNEENGK